MVLSKLHLDLTFFFFFRKSGDETVRFLVESGANLTQNGWTEIDGETFYGSPLELALFLHKRSSGSETSGKMYSIICTEQERQLKNTETESK